MTGQIFPDRTREDKSPIASVSTLFAHLRRANKICLDRIAAILDTLRGLGL